MHNGVLPTVKNICHVHVVEERHAFEAIQMFSNKKVTHYIYNIIYKNAVNSFDEKKCLQNDCQGCSKCMK